MAGCVVSVVDVIVVMAGDTAAEANGVFGDTVAVTDGTVLVSGFVVVVSEVDVVVRGIVDVVDGVSGTVVLLDEVAVASVSIVVVVV